MAVLYDVTLVSATPQPAAAPVLVEIDRIPWVGLSWSRRLGEPGSCNVAAPVDQLTDGVRAELRDLVTGCAELWVTRTDTSSSPVRVDRVHAGPVVGWSIEGRTITITSQGLGYWMEYWPQTSDVSFTGVDQAVIVQQLIDARQALTYGHRGLTTSGLSATGVLRDLTLRAGEGRSLPVVFREIGARENGFDLTVDPQSRAVQLWSPRKGVDRSAALVLDARSIGTPRVAASCAAGVVATDVLATSGSSNGTQLTASATAGTLSAFGRAGFVQSFQDVSVQATLNDHATRLAGDLGAQHLVVSPTLLPVSGFGVGDFDIGDVMLYDYDAGLGRQTQLVRVQQLEVNLGSGAEVLTIGVI
jgi:hypothetical protein